MMRGAREKTSPDRQIRSAIKDTCTGKARRRLPLGDACGRERVGRDGSQCGESQG